MILWVFFYCQRIILHLRFLSDKICRYLCNWRLMVLDFDGIVRGLRRLNLIRTITTIRVQCVLRHYLRSACLAWHRKTREVKVCRLFLTEMCIFPHQLLRFFHQGYTFFLLLCCSYNWITLGNGNVCVCVCVQCKHHVWKVAITSEFLWLLASQMSGVVGIS